MPKDQSQRKKGRHGGKGKPYAKDASVNEDANQDLDEEPVVCCVCKAVIKEPIHKMINLVTRQRIVKVVVQPGFIGSALDFESLHTQC